MPLEWNGDDIVERVTTAARAAVNETVDDARDEAKGSHEWATRTRQLDRNIISEHAEPGEANPTGRFGSTQKAGFYGLFHEEGTVHELERPFLRPAADAHFPGLASKIRRELG